MKLTTKGRYAVTAMLDIALCKNDKPVSLAEISERQGISLSYLEQLFAKLRRNNLVTSMRGPGGGYRLNGEAKDISIASIITAVDESMKTTPCGQSKHCSDKNRKHPCLTHTLWEELSKKIRVFLSGISLEDMKKRAETLNLSKSQQEKPIKQETISIESLKIMETV